MEEYINQIEKFLRGQMSLEEVCIFKKMLTTDDYLRSYAFIITIMMEEQKTW